jgi:hypothetical protein
MLTYLIQVTICWSMLLLLYEVLYKRSTSFTTNRIYLLLSLFTGIVLPMLPWQLPSAINNVPAIHTINDGLRRVGEPAAGAGATGVPDAANGYIGSLILWLYLTGVVVSLTLSIRELVVIMRKAIYGSYVSLQGHKVFSNKRTHAPFSFMGWVFISRSEQYTEQALAHILKHEAAHNDRKHWVDILLVQLCLTVFWFHPLVWRFRHLLKLEHEYEADHIAAGDEAYEYGHFLLQQVLLKGTPAIAHSFHFSPIKNRITMLTKNQKSNNWKYLAVIPAILCCTLLIAKTNPGNKKVTNGDRTAYKGNVFYWTKEAIDSVMVANPETGAPTWVVVKKNPSIYRMNSDSVLSSERFDVAPQFRSRNMSFKDYFKAEFMRGAKKLSDSMVSVELVNVVINEEGKIVYYDTYYASVVRKSGTKRSSITDNAPDYNALVEKIVENCPGWLPGLRSGKPVKTFISKAPELMANFKE